MVRTGGPNWLVRSGWSELDWSDLAVQTGSDWSELVDVNWLSNFLVFQSSLCTCLSRIKVEHLGSITFSNILKLISDRSEFTSFRSIFARFRIIGPS